MFLLREVIDMTGAEKNEINAILKESFRYFVQNNYIHPSNELKMMYYIRDKINLRVAETSSFGQGFGRKPDNISEYGKNELSDM